ncbi:MAG TPA: hypothetical protein PK771_04010 [Spirochaetota bacterium]|nr:hypothetical protein [Spirochaetota bacterium]
MLSDTLLKYEGMKILRENLGIVESEKFIFLIKKEPFNYTEWQREQWKDNTVDELFLKAKEFEEKMQN